MILEDIHIVGSPWIEDWEGTFMPDSYSTGSYSGSGGSGGSSLPPGMKTTVEGSLAMLAKLAKLASIKCKILQILAGSFSAVSKRKFASKYAFGSIFQSLQDVHTFAPLHT